MMEEVIVLGYGNTLRRDDAVGPLVAEAVSAWGRPDVKALALPQLLPELTEPLSRARLAILVDAELWSAVARHRFGFSSKTSQGGEGSPHSRESAPPTLECGGSTPLWVSSENNPKRCRATALQIDPKACEPSLHHTGDPRWLLSLTQAIFGRCPPAWLITVPVADLGYGEGLSPEARRGMVAALQQLRLLLGERE